MTKTIQMEDVRRVKILAMSKQFPLMCVSPKLTLGKDFAYNFLAKSLPDDFVVLGVDYSFKRDAFRLAIWSMEYDKTPEGEEFPDLEPLKGQQVYFEAITLDDGRTVYSTDWDG